MTIAQSVKSISFGRYRSKRSATASTQLPPELACGLPAGMTCSPWEGLYFEDEDSANIQEAEVLNPELERFLLSLMAGE